MTSPDSSVEVAAEIDRYVDFVLAEDPINASDLGVHSRDGSLGDVTPDAVAERRELRQWFLATDRKSTRLNSSH